MAEIGSKWANDPGEKPRIDETSTPEQIASARADATIEPDTSGGGTTPTTVVNDTTKTAGWMGLPTIVWLLGGVAVVYFVGKKQKWF